MYSINCMTQNKWLSHKLPIWIVGWKKKIFCPLCQNTVTFTGMGQKYEREERRGSRMVTAHTAGPQLSLALLRFIPLFLPRFLSVSSLSNKGQKNMIYKKKRECMEHYL